MVMKCRAFVRSTVDSYDYSVEMTQTVESTPADRDAVRQIDSIDRALIAAVTQDARISLTDLAEAINVSRSTAHTRLQRLRDDHVITGFTAIVDPQALGLGVAALVFIDIEQHDWRTLSTELAAIPGVEYLAMCAGRFDLMLIARAESIPAMRDVLLEKIQRIPGVRSTESVIILDEVRS
jgi:DNA-binding Lrp family transcriptional regulator